MLLRSGPTKQKDELGVNRHGEMGRRAGEGRGPVTGLRRHQQCHAGNRVYDAE